MDFRLPSINGQTSQEQIGQMKSYIYQLAEQLNFAFSSLENSNYEIIDTIVKVNGNEEKSTDRQSKFNRLKDLIIKTAAIVNAYEEVWIKEFKGSYTADSDFGKYSRQTLNQITANSTNITAAFTKLSEITNPDSTGMLDIIQAYIKAGLLDESAGEYGLEIGQADNGSFTRFARFTASKLSFYSGNNNEVAYISNNKLFINEAQFNDVVSIGNASGGELNIYNGKINVYVGTGNNQRKVLYADNDGNLVLSGTINAEKGQIAGFNIDGDTLYGAQVGMDAVSGGDYAFWAGAAKGNSANAPFKVGHDGSLYATSGQIGGWGISSYYLECKSDDNNKVFLHRPSKWADEAYSGGEKDVLVVRSQGNYPFILKSDGSLTATKVTVKGTLQAESIIGGWTVLNNGFGIPNSPREKGIYNDGSVSFGNDYGWINCGEYGTWLQGNSYDYPVYITDTYTHTQHHKVDSINIEANYGRLYLRSNYDTDNTDGSSVDYSSIFLYSSNGNIRLRAENNSNNAYIVLSAEGYIHLNTGKGGKLGSSSSTWYLNGSAIATTSDRNKKDFIDTLPDEYNLFFNDLHPVRYKYIDGNSNRYHTGFIAQDVEQAILNSGLSTQDFAGLVKDEDNNYYLRYEEFIALNTWQIQKSKARIAELENTVAELTTKMTELESRLSAIESTLN